MYVRRELCYSAILDQKIKKKLILESNNLYTTENKTSQNFFFELMINICILIFYKHSTYLETRLSNRISSMSRNTMWRKSQEKYIYLCLYLPYFI